MWISTRQYRDITGESKGSVNGRINRGTFPHDVRKREGFWEIWWGSDDEREAFNASDSTEESIEDLLARRLKAYERYRNKHERKYHSIKVDGPCALALVGDPHLDDDGCDLPKLVSDVEVIQKTEGMFALNIGDTTNNWVGRLQAKYKDQTSTESDAFRLAKWFAHLPIWKAWVLGNHDVWNQGGIILDEILSRADVDIVEGDEAHIRIVDGDEVFPVLARHSFKGTSIYNEVHGGMRRALFRPEARLYLSGHFHNWGEHSTEAYDGEPMWTMSARGYKRFDDYARAKDFREYEWGCTRVAVINLRHHHPGEHCKTYHDLEEAAEYLAWVRKRFM